MIKFFRNIRQQLITKNSISKYLLYALGEILLVVIGILIALSINNANDERKERIALNAYLIKISNDVTRDIGQINQLKKRRDEVRSKAVTAFELLLTKDYSELELLQEGGIVFREFYFIPNKSGFEAIKTSAYLGKINNTKLDSLLTAYYAMVDNLENRELGYNTFIEEMEADLKKGVDPIPNSTLNIMQWHPGLLSIDTTAKDWKSNILDGVLPLFEHNSFKAAISRVVSDNLYIERYARLIETGKNLVREIEITINRN